MKSYTAICPKCGTVNDSLYLEETGGAFECSHCLAVVMAPDSIYRSRTAENDLIAQAAAKKLMNPKMIAAAFA